MICPHAKGVTCTLDDTLCSYPECNVVPADDLAIREDALRCLAGLPGIDYEQKDINQLRFTERCLEFEKRRTNRKVIGAMRYGKMSHPDKPTYNYVKRIIQDAQEYIDPNSSNYGNDEILCDIANCAELEYVDGAHPNKHFGCRGDAVKHVEVK